jgi:hypothetical protein
MLDCSCRCRRTIRALSWALFMVFCGSAQAQIGYYKFTVATPDAKVFLDNQLLKKTTDTVYSGSMLEGKYLLKVTKPGFNDFYQDVRVVSDELLDMAIELEYAEVYKTPPRRPERVLLQEESGKLILLSDPPGLPVKVDNFSWDETPVVLVNYPAGRHDVKIGTGNLNLSLLPYGIKRLRLQTGAIREVNWEVERPQHGAARLEAVQIAFTKDKADFENWKTAKLDKYPGLRDPIFKIDNEEWHLLCFLTFSNISNEVVEFAQEFKIGSDDGDVNKHQGVTRVAPRQDGHVWLYHFLQEWKPGYYYIKINDERGPMAVVYYSLHY